MTTRFSPEEVRKIARLSSLELTEIETEIFAEQFSVILEYFELFVMLHQRQNDHYYYKHFYRSAFSSQKQIIQPALLRNLD